MMAVHRRHATCGFERIRDSWIPLHPLSVIGAFTNVTPDPAAAYAYARLRILRVIPYTLCPLGDVLKTKLQKQMLINQSL